MGHVPGLLPSIGAGENDAHRFDASDLLNGFAEELVPLFVLVGYDFVERFVGEEFVGDLSEALAELVPKLEEMGLGFWICEKGVFCSVVDRIEVV